MVTDAGMEHPVTRELPGRNQDKTPPSWGRWFRIIGGNKISGQAVMADGAGRPLFVLGSRRQGPCCGVDERSNLAVGPRL